MSSRLANMKVCPTTFPHNFDREQNSNANIRPPSSCNALVHQKHQIQEHPNNRPRKDSACQMEPTTQAQAQRQDLDRQWSTHPKRRSAWKLRSARLLQKARLSGTSACKMRRGLRNNHLCGSSQQVTVTWTREKLDTMKTQKKKVLERRVRQEG